MVIKITDKYTLAIELIPWIIDSYTMQEIFYMYSSLQNSDLLQSWYWLPGKWSWLNRTASKDEGTERTNR